MFLNWGLTFLLVFLFTALLAQHRSVRFQYLTTEDGLAQNMVDCMLQDSQGFMWFGTWNGLCRYDGYNFEIFNNENDRSNSLKNNFIYALYEDPFGNIWIGTAEGLYTYLYDKGQFIHAENLRTKNYSYLNGIIRVIEPWKENTILIGTSKGLYVVKIIDDAGTFEIMTFLPYGEGEDEIPGTSINTITVDSHKRVWLGTDDGLILFNEKLKVITHFRSQISDSSGISGNTILKVYESRSGSVWIGTEFGLNKYDPDLDRFIKYLNDPADPGSLLHNTVMDIIEDESNNLLVATLGGLSVLEKGSTFKNYVNEINSEHSLNNDFVNCLFKDNKDNIWIGTERGGVNFYNSTQNTIEHFEFDLSDENSLSNSTVNSIYEDHRHLWVGTAGGGLNKYNKREKTFHHYRYNPQDNSTLSGDFVTSIFRDETGRLWVGTWGSGLNILMNEGTKKEYFKHFSGPVEYPGLVSGFISSITQDQSGDLWIGTLGGLVKYDLETETFETLFTHFKDLRIRGVGCLVFDNQQNLWVGTRTGLFYIERPSEKTEYKVTEFNFDPDDVSSISGNYVISIIQDSDGNLWFGTYGQGINKLINENGKVTFERYGTADGLSNNIIYGIEEDAKKNLWLSTDYGLSRFDRKTKKVRNFYISDGLQNNQYYWSASYKNRNGKLYFGGMNGLDSFYPEWIKEVIISPEVVLTDIKLLNESVEPGKEYNGIRVLQSSISKTRKIDLSYKEKVFAVEFSSFNYQEPGMIRYAYTLEGFEEGWNYVSSNRRYANYTNLKPGDYVFKVRASGSNGEFTSESTKLAIHIAPPFWDTNWFRGLCLLVLTGMVFGYIRLRTYSLKRQKMILERQVKERTERINQQKEALSYQAIQLQDNNRELEAKQELIEGQNKKLEAQNKEILSQRDKLIELNKKLKLVSQLKLSFFTNISHEFRTPLTLIISPLERLLKEKKLGVEAKNTLNIINRNAQRLLHLINQIMDFRKIEKGRMELKVTKGNISAFCNKVYDAFKPLSEIKEIGFDYTEKEIPREVWFDSQKVENILYNLLSNAFKYTPNKGSVSMEVTGLTFEESKLNYREALADEDKTVISIRIKDTGLGISKEDLPLVFKRFYRIESEEAFKISGSGIGLALTDELIKTHHGEIFVESELGHGSVFEVQFPCLKASYGTDEVTEGEGSGLNIFQQVEILKNELLVTEDSISDDEESYVFEKSRETVLVVEDNADLRKFITHRFNKTYNILEAGDGEAGIKLAEKWNPDIIISDVMMPKKDGLELCATVKNNLGTSHIPVILLTAKSAVEDQIEGLEIGADDYLPKPFNFDVLAARVQNLIETRAKLRLRFLESMDFEVNNVTSNTKDQKFLEHAIQIVESNLQDSAFGVSEFIRDMGISRSLLHKKLSALTDQSATEFINRIRMKKALSLLKKKELNVSEVAYAVGYNDPKYFTRVFSKYHGQSPKEFIKSQLELN